MTEKEIASGFDSVSASVGRRGEHCEWAEAHGRYIAECRDAEGNLKWIDVIENTVMTEGKNTMLDAALAGSSYTVVGPYMGLISSTSYSAIAAGDVAGQINGTNAWKEAGLANAPTYSGGRKTCAWSSASAGSKALSSSLVFTFTGSGTVKGCFVIYGTGAVSTNDNTSGKLWSAGLFTGGDKTVASSDTLSVSYSTSL